MTQSDERMNPLQQNKYFFAHSPWSFLRIAVLILIAFASAAPAMVFARSDLLDKSKSQYQSKSHYFVTS